MMPINRHNCVNCALKHLASAAVLAKELLHGYESAEYRFYLLGNLSEAQQQLSAIDPLQAEVIRTLRHALLPAGLQAQITKERLRQLETVAITVDTLQKNGFYQFGRPCNCTTPREIPSLDIILPLRSNGSADGNRELRLALRSIERHLTGYRDIIIAARELPPGIRNCRFIQVADDAPRKQQNIHRAITAMLRAPGVADEVIFWADDNVLLQDLAASELPRVRRTGDLLAYPNDAAAKVWHRSLRQTGEALRRAGWPTIDYEAHTPVRLRRDEYLKLAQEFDFESGVGFCYLSLYLNRYGTTGARMMQEVKATFEHNEIDPGTLAGKLFAGYNDAAVEGGILPLLEQHFPVASRYEQPPRPSGRYPATPAIGAVLGTYGSAPFVELGLHYLTKVNHLPVLVVDDASGDSRLEAVCRRYGAELLRLPCRHGHFAGDLQVFAAGLEWAKQHRHELVVKLSRRFIPCREWVTSLRQLAKASDAVTFSSYTTSYGYGFRTECAALAVDAWGSQIASIRETALPGQRIFVERFLHEKAKKLAEEYRTPRYDAFTAGQRLGRNRQGYACWSELLGTDRKNPPPDVLWHNAAAPAKYAAAAQALGLPYQESDFQ